MKFHEVEMVGKFLMQSIPVLPTWISSDVGRLVFVEAENAVYYGGNSTYRDWINLSGLFTDEGTATDPATGLVFTGRQYEMKVVNGNIRLYY
jgi:hypothetical protein